MSSWRCIACGDCCRKFIVALTSYEVASLIKAFGYEVLEVDRYGGTYLKKVDGACIFQSYDGLCTLQPLGLKPLACKVWPFKVVEVKDLSSVWEKEFFSYRGRLYKACIHTFCRGIGRGCFKDLLMALKEVIELREQPTKFQIYSTALIATTLGPDVSIKRSKTMF